MPCSPSHNVLLPHGRQHAAQRSQLAKLHPAQPQRVSGLKLQAVPCRLSRQQQCTIRSPGSCRTASTKHQGSPMQPTRVRVETADRALHDVGCAAPAHHAQLQWREGGRAEQVPSSGHAVSKRGTGGGQFSCARTGFVQQHRCRPCNSWAGHNTEHAKLQPQPRRRLSQQPHQPVTQLANQRECSRIWS